MSDQQTIDDLRRRLFETIDGVRSGEISIDKARAIGQLSSVIVDSARVEVEHRKLAGSSESPFIEGQQQPALPSGITRVTRHRLAG